MNSGAMMSWKDGLRIVDLCELAKQMYCRECRSLLDLNGTENETRIGFASVLFIPCRCGVVNDVHTAKRLSTISCQGKQSAIEAYEINIKVSKAGSVERHLLAAGRVERDRSNICARGVTSTRGKAVVSYLRSEDTLYCSLVFSVKTHGPADPPSDERQPASEGHLQLVLRYLLQTGTASLTTKDSWIIKHFLAVLHIPLEFVLPTAGIADNIQNTLGQSVFADDFHQGQVILQQNEDKCIQKRDIQQAQHSFHSAGFSELQATHVVVQKQPEFLENATLLDNASASVSASMVQCLTGGVSACSAAGQNLVAAKESDAPKGLCDGLASVGFSYKVDGDSNNASEPPSANCLNSVENSLFKSEKGECKKLLTAPRSSSNHRKSSERGTCIDQTSRRIWHTDSLARPTRKKQRRVAKKRKECGQQKDASKAILLKRSMRAKNTLSSDISLESCAKKRSVSRSGYSKEKHSLPKTKVKKGHVREHFDLSSGESRCPVCSKVMSTPRNLRIHLENFHAKSVPSRKAKAKAFQNKRPGQTSSGYEPFKIKESQASQKGEISACVSQKCAKVKYTDDFTDIGDRETINLHIGQLKSPSEKDNCKSEGPESVKSNGLVCSSHSCKSDEQKKHHAQKQHECKKCLSQFPTANQLKIHRKTHTVSEPKDVHECTICLKTFPNGRRLRAHRTTHTREERLCPLKRYKCELCGEEFKKNYFLQIHLRYHKGERPYRCPICDVAFVTKPERRAHFKKCVVKKKTYLCEQCGSRFGSGCTLRKHERIHTGEKPHQCRFCEKAFSRTNTLKIHERQHTGERPYVCDQCTASFKQRVSLVTHMRSKHNVNVTLYSQPRDGPRYAQSALGCKSKNTSDKPAPVEHQRSIPCVVTDYGNTTLQQVPGRQISDLKRNSNMFSLAQVDADMLQTSIPDASLQQPVLMSQSNVIHFNTSSSENLVHLAPAAHIVSLSQDIQIMGSSVNQRALVLQENNVLSAIQASEPRVLGISSQETSIFSLCPSNLSAAMENMYYN